MKRILLFLAMLSLIYQGFAQINLPDNKYFKQTLEERASDFYSVNENIDSNRTCVVRYKYDDGLEYGIFILSDKSGYFCGVVQFINQNPNTHTFTISDISRSGLDDGFGYNLKIKRKVVKHIVDGDKQHKIFFDDGSNITYKFDCAIGKTLYRYCANDSKGRVTYNSFGQERKIK